MNVTYNLSHFVFLMCSVTLVTSCTDDEYKLPTAKNELQNDCIKRSIGPNLVGRTVEFAYAMALPKTLGKLASARVEASIPGATGTYLEHRAYSANSSGVDVGAQIGDPSSTEGNFTNVVFTVDTSAATLRYFYVAPEEARGQPVDFTFSATDSNGKTVSYKMGPYLVSAMDMVLDSIVSDNNAMYISIADMSVYTAAEAAATPDKIDLVYLNRTIPNIAFNHALVAPGTDPVYLQDVVLPAGVDNSTKIMKTLNLRDRQLARLQFGIFIDDIDFRQLDMAPSTNQAVNVKADNGLWIETEDGKYRAFVFVNAIDNTAKTMRISIKRLTML
jgi:Domain of unknown function (DUF4466)